MSLLSRRDASAPNVAQPANLLEVDENDFSVDDEAASVKKDKDEKGKGDLLGGDKKARAPVVTFKESHLVSKAGMWQLYSQMQRLPLTYKKGNEVRILGRRCGRLQGG